MFKTLKTNQIKLNPTTAIALTLSAAVLGFVIYATFAASNISTVSPTNSSEEDLSGTDLSPDIILTNPNTVNTHKTILAKRMAQRGDVTAQFYWETFTSNQWVYFRNHKTGDYRHVQLPGYGSYHSALWASNDRLYVLGKVSTSGDMLIREFLLEGDGLPTSITLADEFIFGDAEGRPDDIIELSSGTVVAAWHQHNNTTETGPQGVNLAYRKPNEAWTVMERVGMYTKASKSVLAQHPDDQTIWVFNNPDAWGRIQAVRFTETAGDIQLDWVNNSFINTNAHGEFGPDPENPQLAAAADSHTNEIVLAYQSRKRQIFSDNDGKWLATGSFPALARIKSDGTMAFIHGPKMIERVASFGLVVQPGQLWLAYPPLDLETKTFNTLEVSKHENGTWQNTKLLGSIHPYAPINYSTSRPEFSAVLNDGDPDKTTDDKIHFFTVVSTADLDPDPDPEPDPNPDPTPGDINQDGKVDVFDLSIMLDNWETSDSGSDLNNDGTVNVFDLSILLDNWGS